MLEHSCEWSFPAIAPFGWEAPVDPPWPGLLMQAMVAPAMLALWGKRPERIAKGKPWRLADVLGKPQGRRD